MSELMQLTLVLLAGMLLGVLFFGSLWWTVQKGLASSWPALWFMGSLLLRIGITLPGFYVVADSDWQRLLVCLSGFVAARIIVTRLSSMSTLPEVNHAP